ncbi:hypothetical protein D3C77_665080 [compost metagenome]
MVAWLEMVCVVFHERGVLIVSKHFKYTSQCCRLPVALSSEAISGFHQALYSQTRKLLEAVQIFERRSERPKAARFKEPLHRYFQTCLISNGITNRPSV